MDEKVETLQKELQHVRKENNTLRLMLEVLSSKCTKLESHFQEINKKEEQKGILSNQAGSVPSLDASKRARIEFPTAKKPLQIFFRTQPNDDSLIIKDGYQWRKYGQKVTKDNDSPRAYFRCSMAPSCPAKKKTQQVDTRLHNEGTGEEISKVQKCIHDRSIIVATYDGEHNHSVPHESFRPSSSTPEGSSILTNELPPTPSEKEAINIDSDMPGWAQTSTELCENVMQQCGYGRHINIEEYVGSLIKDPDFTTALAEAVARTITDQHKQQQDLNLNLDLPEE